MPEFIFPAFRPAVALPDLIRAIEDLFFRGAFHQLVLLAGTTSARRGQGPVRTNTVQARPSPPALYTHSDMLGRFPYTSKCVQESGSGATIWRSAGRISESD